MYKKLWLVITINLLRQSSGSMLNAYFVQDSHLSFVHSCKGEVVLIVTCNNKPYKNGCNQGVVKIYN